MLPLILDLKNKKAVVVPVDATPSNAGYGAAVPVKLPSDGIYLVDVDVNVFIRDQAGDGDSMQADGNVPIELRLTPATARAMPLKLARSVLVSSEGGAPAVVIFVPLLTIEAAVAAAAPSSPAGCKR